MRISDWSSDVCSSDLAISRRATTGFLSRSRSSVSSAPPEISRARCAASRTRSKRLVTLSTQSSTVTRAKRALLNPAKSYKERLKAQVLRVNEKHINCGKPPRTRERKEHGEHTTRRAGERRGD